MRSWLAVLNKDRHLFVHWWPVWLGFGIAGYFNLSQEPGFQHTQIICSALILSTFILWRFLKRYDVYYTSPIPFFLGIPLFISLGFLAANFQTAQQMGSPLIKDVIKYTSLQGCVKNIEHAAYGNKGHITIEDSLHATIRATIIESRLYGMDVGDIVICKGDIFPLMLPSTPSGYDSARHLYFSGIRGTGRMHHCHITQKRQERSMDSLRFYVTSKLRQHLPGQRGEIAAALITGDRSGIQSELRQKFADGGLAHLLAISGLHVSIVAGLFFLVFWRLLTLSSYLALHHTLKKWAAFLAIPATYFYGALAGFGYPVLRSLVMTTLILVAVMINRRAISMRSLSIAALFILLVYPNGLVSASFQMSFAAVIALISCYELVYRPFQQWTSQNKVYTWLTYFLAVVLSTVIATIATTPFSVALFNRLTLQAIIGNVMAIPLTSFVVMPVAALSTLSLSFDGLGIFFKLFGWSLDALIWVAEFTSTLPGAAIQTPTPPPSFLISFVLGGIWFALWKQTHRFAGLCVMILSPLWFLISTAPDVYVGAYPTVLAVHHGKKLYISRKVSPFLQKQYTRDHATMDANVHIWPEDTMILNETLFTTQSYIPPELCQGIKHVIAPNFLCPNTSHILYGNQAFFIWLKDKKGIDVKDMIGNRPWYPSYISIR